MKRIWLPLLLIFVAGFLTGCKEEAAPEPTQIPIPNELAQDITPEPQAGHLEMFVQRHTLKVAKRPFGIALSPDGSRAYVAAALLGQIAVIDVGDLEMTEKWGSFGEHLFSVIPSSDGKILFAFGLGGQHLFAINTKTGRLIQKMFLGRNISDVIAGNSDTLLVASTQDRKVTIVNQLDLSIIGEVTFGHPIGYIAIGQSGDIACATGGVYAMVKGESKALGGPVSFFDPTKGGEAKEADVLRVGAHTRKPVFVQNDRYLLVPDRLDHTVRVFDVQEKRLAKILDVGAGAEKILVHPTEPLAYTINTLGRSVTVLSLRPFNMIRQIPLPANPEDGIISTDGKHLYLTLPALAKVNNRIAVIDLEENTLIDLIPTGQDPCRMAISKDGKTLLVTNFLGNSLSILR